MWVSRSEYEGLIARHDQDVVKLRGVRDQLDFWKRRVDTEYASFRRGLEFEVARGILAGEFKRLFPMYYKVGSDYEGDITELHKVAFRLLTDDNFAFDLGHILEGLCGG
jgi:hypothetical protein